MSPRVSDAALSVAQPVAAGRLFLCPGWGNGVRRRRSDQFLRPVMWQQSVETVLALGVRRFYVTGPGSAAFGLLRRVAQHHKTPIKAEKI